MLRLCEERVVGVKGGEAIEELTLGVQDAATGADASSESERPGAVASTSRPRRATFSSTPLISLAA